MFGLITKFSHPTLRTFQLRVFFQFLQKRAKQVGPKLPVSASYFKVEHLDLLRVNFKPASAKTDVIPVILKDIENTDFPEQYIVPCINKQVLSNLNFDVLKFGCISDPYVQTFITKLHEAKKNTDLKGPGRDEAFTVTLLDDLLRIVKFNAFPLMIRNKLNYELYIGQDPLVIAKPEFIIRLPGKAMVAVENKHLKIVRPITRYGESQLAIEILASGSENLRDSFDVDDYKEQTIFSMRVISTFVTFYKTVISSKYWEELEDGLPKEQSVEIHK
ncbi:hypothetical protein C1645_741491 [Glomus cerebriforme]|uniref:Uncharacterized protein n=1 Tax=Glomus cerebriforme TaxID=658196 RepID=A0A397SSD1_9GLOM|nr:hypothetical protein C1645_741491 [Glomus cerebriforme]